MGLVDESQIEKTQDSINEEASQIKTAEGAGEEVPGFETGEDKSEQMQAANEPAAQEQSSTAVAEQQNTQVAETGGGVRFSSGQATAMTVGSAREVSFDNDEDDLGGRVVDAFSFGRITQKDGTFKLGDEILGTSFQFIFQSSTKRFMLKDEDAKEDDDSHLAYTYSDDPNHPDAVDTNGALLSDVRAKWAEEGVENITTVRYLDISAILVSEDETLDGSMVTIQVPQTSISKVSGKLIELKQTKLRRVGKSLKQAILEMSAPKSVGEGKRKFYPYLCRFSRFVD